MSNDNTDQMPEKSESQKILDEFAAAAEAKGIEESMWVNAFNLVRPTDEFAQQIGRDIITMLQNSMRRKRPNQVEPIGLITVRISAS